MKGKVSKNKFLKVVLPALLVVAIICQAVGFQAVLAKGNVATTSSDSISNLTDQQLQALTNPILQSYKADSSHKVWKMTDDSRLAVLANQTNIENARLQEVVKLVNSEFVEKEIISSPLAMVYAQEKDVSYGDILIDIDQTSSITSSSNSKEAYKITIGENGVRLTGASENAIMHGLRTIQNLIITNDGLVYGEIVDYPNVAERRVHVDCARKYISKDWFIRQIREMSYMKMNALQIHFSENMGFRIECETDPSIVSDQYLTKTEVREILAEAKKYGINVIPSFDSPGHVDQILKAHPEYVMGGSYAVWCDDPNYESEQSVEDKIYHRTRATAYKMWNANDNQPDYDVFKAAVDKLGRTPGFNEALPAPGEVFQGEDTATVTIKYIDNFGKTIAADDVFYGLNDSEYHFEAKELFGYSFIESDLPLDGKYNGNMTITLKYQLHCDKTDLKKEIFEPLAVSEYINETVADYNKALTMAKEIYFDETSGQLAVNNALRALQDAKNKAVKLEYYSLYVEVTYPLNESDYSSGYQAYKNAVATGKTLLNSEGLTVEKAKEAYNAIQTAKQSLVKPNAKVPTISATDTYYQSNNYNNMIDDNINTKCWFNSNQEIGKEVKFTFTRPINISSIQIIQPSNAGEDIIDGADVQISTDGKNWTTVGTLDNSAFEKTITFDKTLTKYVRIVLTEGKGNWYQIAEVKFELEEIPEDSTLKDMILEAETLNITGKSSGSVNEMIDALIVAQKSYVEGKVDVTEETNNLRNAINALRDTVTSNKEKLTNKINDAKEIENNNYSIESWSRFEKALLEAIIVNEDSNATQEQVDKAYDDLDKAIKGLIDAPVIVDKKELSNVIETTNDFVEKDYTVDSWKAFKEALDHAKDVLQNENTTQDEVDQALASLQDAIKNLKTVSQTGNNDQPNQKPNDQIQTSIKKEDDNKTSSTKNNSHIKTGDDMSVVPYILLMATAGGYIALQRRNKEN